MNTIDEIRELLKSTKGRYEQDVVRLHQALSKLDQLEDELDELLHYDEEEA